MATHAILINVKIGSILVILLHNMDSVPTSNGSICQLKHTALNIAKCLCHILCNTHQLGLHVGNTLVILWKMQKLNMEIKFDLKLIYPNPDKWDDHHRVQHSCYFLWAVQGAFNDITPNVEWVE